MAEAQRSGQTTIGSVLPHDTGAPPSNNGMVCIGGNRTGASASYAGVANESTAVKGFQQSAFLLESRTVTFHMRYSCLGVLLRHVTLQVHYVGCWGVAAAPSVCPPDGRQERPMDHGTATPWGRTFFQRRGRQRLSLRTTGWESWEWGLRPSQPLPSCESRL